MRFLSLVGLYQRPAGVEKLASGVSYSTQPTDVPYGALAVEDGSVFEFVRISGTCTVGDLMYQTGTAQQYVVKGGFGKPYGLSLVKPTASGVWSWIQKYGKNTSIQITSTFGGTAAISNVMFADTSAAINHSGILTAASANSAAIVIGHSLTAATGSQTVGFINLL